jgi:hypothetical protein
MRKKLGLAFLGVLLVGSIAVAAAWVGAGGGDAPASRDIFPKVLNKK